MASYHHLLQHTKPRFESPAKIFAKLKSKVQREGLCAKDGTFTVQDPLCNATEKHGAVFRSPRKRAESTWMTDELKENHRSGFYRDEAQALTFSPISSPQKTFACSGISRLLGDVPSVTEMGHEYTPRRGTFLGPAAVSHQSPLVNRKRIHTDPPLIRDMGGFKVTSRTPVKIHPVEDDSVFEEACAPLDKLVSPSCMFSPMRKRLRKRKWEPQEFNKVSSSTKEASDESMSQPQERKTSSALSEDNTCMEDMDYVRGIPAEPSEINHFTAEPVLTSPRTTRKKRCLVDVERLPTMSPAKMFAYMKERESRKEQQEIHRVSSSTRDLFDADDFHRSRDTPPSAGQSTGDMEDVAFRGVPDSVVPVSQSRVESADSQSDTDPSEDVLNPAVSPQPVLLEDPLVLNTPRISIPKKQEAAFKPNKWPQRTKFPSDSVIYLKQWYLRKNSKGLFVDGIHQHDSIPWNSNIIVERVSKSMVKTVSGRVYVLVGKMNMSVKSEFPKWLLKKFSNGFPPDWEALYERFLSESREEPSRETERNSEGRGVASKTKSGASSVTPSVRQHRKNTFKTPDSCPPASLSCAKVSRSGRVIKPPLEYWKGGRVILDAQMNVTIHECYDTSICIPEVTTTVSTRASQKPVRVFLPCSEGEGRKQCESASGEGASVPLRKVKAPVRKRNRARVMPEERPSHSPEPPVETHSSTEEGSDRRTRSSQRRPAQKRTLYEDTVSQKQSKPQKTSKKQTHHSTRPSVRAVGSKRAIPASPESVNDIISASSPEEVTERKKQQKEGHKERSRRAPKSRPNYALESSDSSQSSEELKEVRKKTKVTRKKHKQSKRAKSSSPKKPSPKLTQSSKKPKAKKGNAPIPQQQDEDAWTEAELRKLQEAVSYYPKHMEGYWTKVARMVGTRSAEECHCQHTSLGTSRTPAKKSKKTKKEKVEVPKDPDRPVISARAGTFKRKQQVRQFLETMPRDDVEDVFSSAYMQNKRFEIPSMCQSEHDLPDIEPLTPMSTGFPEVKTPQCLHITPGMMGSPSRTNDDKYVHQLQRRMKKNQFNVCKKTSKTKSFTPTPSVKRTMRRCGNEDDTFVVWHMFPGNDGVLSDSGEEEDFYFSDNN